MDVRLHLGHHGCHATSQVSMVGFVLKISWHIKVTMRVTFNVKYGKILVEVTLH